MPIPAAAQPTPNGQTTALSADIQPQPVQDGLSGPALTGQDAPAPAGTAGAADTRQEEAQGAGFKAYSKARKAPLIAVDANTQETASDAAPPAQQPDAQKQCTTPQASSMVLLMAMPDLQDFTFHMSSRQQDPVPTKGWWAAPIDTQCLVLQAAGIDKREVGKIMQKLGQKGTTEEGLMDLYQYMQKHPHLKLDQIMNLSVASATFRKYLEDGLRKAAYRDKLAREGEPASLVLVQTTYCVATMAMLRPDIAFLSETTYTCRLHIMPWARQGSCGMSPRLAVPWEQYAGL